MTEAELSEHLEILLAAFVAREEDCEQFKDQEDASLKALVDWFAQILAKGFNASRQRMKLRPLSQQDALKEYQGGLFLWLCVNDRFQRYIYYYWIDRGCTLEAFQTAWYQAARWSAWEQLRTRAEQPIPAQLSNPCPTVTEFKYPEESSLQIAPELAGQMVSLQQFILNKFNGDAGDQQDAALLVLRYYVFIAEMNAAQESITRTVQYCAMQSGMTAEQIRAEMNRLRFQLAQNVPRRRKSRDMPELPYKDIGRWMGVSPGPTGYHSHLQSRMCRLQKHLQKSLLSIQSIEAPRP